MKLYRFVGEKEMSRLINGETLINTRDWSEINDTNSIGFCFFAYNRTNDLRKIVANALDEWGLAGIVKADYIVEIEIDNARKAWGWYSGGKRTEYNLTSYSINNVKSIHKVARLDAKDWLVCNGYFYCYGITKIF